MLLIIGRTISKVHSVLSYGQGLRRPDPHGCPRNVKRDNSKLSLFLAHRSALVDYATPIVGCRARAEDVVQEAFLRFVPRGEQHAPDLGQPVAYLYRIVRNLAFDLIRRRSVEHRQEAAEPAWWMLPARPRTPEQEAVHRRDLTAIGAALAELPRDARLAVEMHRFGGYTLGEIAQRLGVSVPTVHRLIRDALVRIADTLGEPQDG